MDLIQVRFIFGFIGSVISIGCMALKVPSFVAMYKNKSVGGALSPIQLVDIFLHNMLWFFYGIVNKDSSYLVSTTCAVYMGLSAIYLTVFFISCGHEKDLCGSTVSRLMVGIIGVVGIVLITLFAIESPSAKLKFVGVVCDISFILFMLRNSLLTLVISVVTESVTYISYSICIVTVINGLVWSAYSCFYRFDLYLLVCSVLQMLVCTAKLIVYARYYKSTPMVKSD